MEADCRIQQELMDVLAKYQARYHGAAHARKLWERGEMALKAARQQELQNPKLRFEKLGAALDELWGVLDYGYLLGDGAASRFAPPGSLSEPQALGSGDWHCGLCNSTHAIKPEEVQHEEGCIGKEIDVVVREWRALMEAFGAS